MSPRESTPEDGAVEIPPALAGVRLDRAVAFLADVPRTEAARLVDEGGVSLAGVPVRERARRLREHDRLTIDLQRIRAPTPASELPRRTSGISYGVVYEDEEIIVVDKPAGLVVHPGAGNSLGTLAGGLVVQYPELARLPAAGAGEPDRPGIVHRLDKDTSGLLAVARTPAAYRSLTMQLARRTMGRTYRAIVLGRVDSAVGIIDAPIGRSGADPTRMAVSGSGRTARTRYEVKQRYTEPLAASYMELNLETGRTHQIRVHVAAIGHPVLGDRRYGGARGAIAVERPMLHAMRLSLDHPATGSRVEFTCNLPADFARVLASLS
ncbi:MAG: RluA family pseudouridine synthase [Acidimicrobiales bacterium]